MDLLEQYNKQYPEASREHKPSPLMDEYGRTYTGMIAGVMRLSGGRIRDARTAVRVLLGVGVAVFAVSIAIFLYNSVGFRAPASPAKNIDQRQFSNEL